MFLIFSYDNLYFMYRVLKTKKNRPQSARNYWIFGTHAVIAAIKNKERVINKIFVNKLRDKIFLKDIEKYLVKYKKK